jgi:hypothetical protein
MDINRTPYLFYAGQYAEIATLGATNLDARGILVA